MTTERKATLRRFDVDALSFLHSESVLMMEMAEVGQYWLLLCHSWVNEKDVTLPDDPVYLAKMLRIPEISPRVLAKFDKLNTADGPRLRNATLYDEWLRAKKRSEYGLRDANKRWHPMGTQSEPISHYHSHTNTKDQNITSNELKLELSPETLFAAHSDTTLLRVWDYYLQQTDKNGNLYTFTPVRKQMGLKRLMESGKKVHGDLDKAAVLMRCAIDAMVASDFHQGKNDSKKKYLDWELLFRSTEKFEQWLERANQ